MKAILVIDMPKTCDDCSFLNYTNGVGLTICENKDQMIPDEGKPSWCPLKPMPTPIPYEQTDTQTVKAVKVDNGFRLGWNACLKEIEK